MGKTQVVAAIIQKDRRFLLGKRSLSKKSSPGCWSSISGRIEDGESETAAIARECLEEVGLIVQAIQKVSEFDTGQARIHWWLVQILSGQASLKNEEHSELRWFDLEEINQEKNINPNDLHVFTGLDRRLLFSQS